MDVEFCEMLFLYLLRWSCSFLLLLMCITLILHMLNHPCEFGVNLTWSWCMIFSMCCWIWFANILLRVFASIFIRDIGLQFSFLVVSFVWFWHQGDGGFVKCLWECSLFEKNQYKFFFVCLVEFACEAVWSWNFVYRVFCLFLFFSLQILFHF